MENAVVVRTKSVGFHPRRRVDRVTKETVARHLETDDASHYGARVQPDTQFQLVVGPVSYTKVSDSLQESQRHACDLAGMQIAVPDGQAGDYHVSIADRLHLNGDIWSNQWHVIQAALSLIVVLCTL